MDVVQPTLSAFALPPNVSSTDRLHHRGGVDDRLELGEVGLGVEAAGRELEDIAAPLSAQEAEEQQTAEAGDALTVGGTSEPRAREHAGPVGPPVIESGDVVSEEEFEHGGWHPRDASAGPQLVTTAARFQL